MIIDKILVEAADIELAHSVCNMIDNPDIRNRSVANVIGANIAKKFFEDIDMDIDTASGLHNIGCILDDIDISDIYLNNYYIDVRVVFNENELYIPKSHIDNDILPLAYMFIKLSDDISSAELLGFLKPKTIDLSNIYEDSYIIKKENLISFYDIENIFQANTTISDVKDIDIFAYIDNIIPNKQVFYKNLLTARAARIKLAKAIQAQNVFELISIQEQDADNNLNDFSANSDNETENELLDLLNQQDSEDSILIEPVEEQQAEYTTVTSPSLANTMKEESDKNESIDTLFETEDTKNETVISNQHIENKKKASILPVILILILLAGGGYYAYQRFNADSQIQEPQIPNDSIKKEDTVINKEEAMPIESIEPPVVLNNKEEGNAVSIPAIEKNLDASILVSNLKVDWEVPAGYVSNTSAKRYLIKLGKIIQLNLKTELLLLSRPPITNKISVEIKYNDTLNQFETVGIVASSGEQTVDNVILETIKRALKMNLSTGTDSFGKLQGNPVLVIHL